MNYIGDYAEDASVIEKRGVAKDIYIETWQNNHNAFQVERANLVKLLRGKREARII